MPQWQPKFCIADYDEEPVTLQAGVYAAHTSLSDISLRLAHCCDRTDCCCTSKSAEPHIAFEINQSNRSNACPQEPRPCPHHPAVGPDLHLQD